MVVPGVGGRAEGALRSPGTSLEEVVVPLLVNELIELPGRVVLVLDDLHAVADEEIHRSLVAFVERLPATVHLAVATRADPPWPMLPRLRARDQLVELRSGQMRFSEAEAGSLPRARSGSSSPPTESPRSSSAPRAGRRACSSPGCRCARYPASERLRRRAGRRQPGDRRLPGRGGPRSRGAAGAALPAADLDPGPHVRARCATP